MSAHPMLQPVDWSKSPDSLEGAIHPTRLMVYRTLWDSAIAVTLRAPHLAYERTLARTLDGTLVAAMTINASPERQGYWPFRQDFPASIWPTATSSPTGPILYIEKALPVRANALTLGKLISRTEAESIGTPATTADLLKTAIQPEGNRPPSLLLDEEVTLSSPGMRKLVRVSDSGRQALEHWRKAGLIEDAAENQTELDLLAQGDLTVREVLAHRFPELSNEVVDRICADIEGQCDRWRGLSHADGLRAITREQAKPPKLSGLPRWIDPDKQFAEDHPLRQLRNDMEGELASTHHDWATMTGHTRAQHRLAWLRAHQLDNQDIPNFDDEYAQFNAVIHWLLGEPMSEPDLRTAGFHKRS